MKEMDEENFQNSLKHQFLIISTHSLYFEESKMIIQNCKILLVVEYFSMSQNAQL